MPLRAAASERPFATVSLSSTTARRFSRFTSAISRSVFCCADDVEREQHVVRHAGVGEHLDLAELLAGDAHRAGLHLQLAQRRDLVRLDVRTVREAVLREMPLHARGCCLP